MLAKTRKSSKERIIPIAEIKSCDGEKLLKTILDAREQRSDEVCRTVSAVLEDVRRFGDRALFDYTKKYDNVRLTSSTMRISVDHLQSQAKKASRAFKRVVRESIKRIREYHSHQGLTYFRIKTTDGELRQVIKPLNRVGIYIPGGQTVYPSTVLMCAIPAKFAGVKNIVAVTPPRGDINPGVAYALCCLNITEVYHVGGAQAIGALAYGTKTIPRVDKIVGPGNSYVAAAKRLVYGSVDIDSVAGPSDVVIIADTTASPRLVALDLLAQAEHGSGDEIAVCIVESEQMAAKISDAITTEIQNSPIGSTLAKLPAHAISIFITSSRKESIMLSDTIAPEHLQLMTSTAPEDLQLVNNAAAVFMGMDTPTAMGDYFIGTNHVLPTGGGARFASPLGVESFQKRIAVAEVSRRGLKNARESVPIFARAEALEYHAMSVEERC